MAANPTFTQQVQTIAAKLRGAYLETSCDVEWVLADLTCICLVSNEEERKAVKEILLDGAMMSKKIYIAANALKRYNIDYYSRYGVHFKKFKELKDLRNQFAHSVIEGDPEEKDLSWVKFKFIEEGEMQEKVEKVQDLYNNLQEYATYFYDMMSKLIPILYQERGQAKS